MEIKTHLINNKKIAEITSDEIIIQSIEDGTDLVGNLYYQDFGLIIIHEKNITPEFFNLKTGIAGEILQKFSNYRLRLAIVGDFSRFESKSIRDFIFESNKTKHINFAKDLAEALEKLSQ